MKTKKLPFKIEPNVDNYNSALTLDTGCVTELTDSFIELNKQYSKQHSSGWTITAAVNEDYYMFINEFVATHLTYGTVSGNFEDVVYASSKKAYNHFVKNHPPESWSYEDI